MATGFVLSLSDIMVSQEQNSFNQLLQHTITHAVHDFMRASPDLHKAAVLTAKKYLDPLAVSVSDAQLGRLGALRKKRKRGDVKAEEDVLRLKQLYIQDFSTEQIWEQSKRILDAAARETKTVVDRLNLTNGQEKSATAIGFEGDGSGSDEDDIIEDQEDSDIYRSEADLQEDELLEDELLENIEDGEELEDGSDIEQDDNKDGFDVEDGDDQQRSTFTKDKHGLNDGFFSIDDFNRATEFLEQVDARGDPNDGAASDEEDVDWATNPMDQQLAENPTVKKSNTKTRDHDDGPTFGDADLNAPWSDDDNDEEEDVDMADADDGNTNEIYYKDFFAPPPRALTKTKRRRALPKTQPTDVQEEDIQRTISAVHRDIFSDDDVDGSEASAVEDNKNLSTHEKRQKALAEQIRQLEAEAIAKREWTLTGEARAADRPVNSLLEDDLILDFERTGKPVPEATQATTEAIEDLIKARILARNFDDIPKRRGGLEVGGLAQGKRGRIELDDRKNPQSLAEIYEKEHLKSTDPNYIDTRDAATKKAHAEIEGLWKSVSIKLDALCSWHYKPKPVDMEIKVITDAPRVQMEDARPAGVGIGAEESGLAPQEVYRVGEDLGGKKGDAETVLTTGGAIVARAELTREEKLRRRRREKERIKKKGSSGAGQVDAGNEVANGTEVQPTKRNKKANEKKNILEELKRGNVKVIGKGGAVQDVEGNKAKLGGGERSVGGLKL